MLCVCGQKLITPIGIGSANTCSMTFTCFSFLFETQDVFSLSIETNFWLNVELAPIMKGFPLIMRGRFAAEP